MNIISATTTTHNGPTATVIEAMNKDGNRIFYTYSHTYQLLRDPNNPVEWAQWNGGSLTEAILWIISL